MDTTITNYGDSVATDSTAQITVDPGCETTTVVIGEQEPAIDHTDEDLIFLWYRAAFEKFIQPEQIEPERKNPVTAMPERGRSDRPNGHTATGRTGKGAG